MRRIAVLWLGFIVSAVLSSLPLSAAKPTVTFKANPTSIARGASSTLTWTSTNATSASIDNGIGTVPVSGSRAVSPTATTTYKITVKGSGGSVTAQVTVKVTVPKPTVSFAASPGSILAGETSTLSWTTANATSVSINNGIGAVALNGSRTVAPTATVTYTLTATGSGGTTTAAATVSIPPPTVAITASPLQVVANETSLLSWSSTNATSASIDALGAVEPNGSATVTVSATTTYVISVFGPGGSAEASVTVTVAPRARISASPGLVAPGEESLLAWVTESAEQVEIDNGIGTVAASGSLRVAPASTTVYTLTASGGGATTTARATVTVDPALTPLVGLFARSSIVQIGKPAHLSWLAAHALSAEIDNGIGALTGRSGLILAYPSATTAFTLTAANASGQEAATARVTVRPAPVCRIYVAIETGNRLAVIDARNSNLVKSIAVGEYPRGAVLSPDGTRVYVNRRDGIDVVDTASDSVVASIPVTGIKKCMAVHPDGRRLYAECQDKSSGEWVYSLALIDTATLAETRRLTLGGIVLGMAVHPAGTALYVTQYTQNRFLVLDPYTLDLCNSLDLTLARGVAVSPDGKKLYVIQGYNAPNPNFAVLDAETLEVTATLTLRVNGIVANLYEIAVNPEGTRLVVAMENHNFAAINPAGPTLVSQVQDSCYTPDGLCFHPDGSRLYVTCTNSSRVLSVDPANLSSYWPINPGGPPTGFAAFAGHLADSVSGSVTLDGGGAGGITLTASGEGIARSATTGSSGAYALALPDGRFTLAPSSPGQYFSPSQRQVEVHGSLTSLNFAMSATPFTPTAALSASPATIDLGASSLLSWSTDNATSATLDNGIGDVPLSGTRSVSPSATTAYTLTATGPGGSATSRTTVTIYVPPPTAALSASPQSVFRGESSTLSWTTTGAETVSLSSIGQVDLNGSRAVGPTVTTAYTLTATGPGGSATASVTVEVKDPPPVIVFFKADPDVLVPDGTSTLSWKVENATSVTIDNGIGSMPLEGSVEVAPTVETLYTLTATGPGGTVQEEATLRILDQVLRDVWNGMKSAISMGNVEEAVEFFCDDSKEKYRDFFTELTPQLIQIAGDMNEIEPLGYKKNFAIYRLKRNEIIDGVEYEISYRINFVCNEGKWEILSF